MSPPYHLFDCYGVELEYMLVDRRSLDVRPITDEVLKDVAGAYVSDVDVGPLSWSNELVLHVIELKTNGPAPRLDGLHRDFQADVRRINDLLAPRAACLMPSSMHPWMHPDSETRLWPHEYNAVYAAFDRIFNCRGHGWSNLQSVHLNLPFTGDEEFGRLHAAIRLVLPILPALAASSPIADGTVTGLLDTRLEYYRNNARRIPLAAGRVIPEPAFSRAAYEQNILQPLYRAIAPHDPAGTLQYEWLNARGTIARFDRDAFEIRVLDIQECPAADLAILALIVATLQALVTERWTPLAEQQAWPIDPLEPMFLACLRDADAAVIDNAAYLRTFGYEGLVPCTARDLWRHLYDTALPPAWRQEHGDALRIIFDEGPLARRILRAVGPSPDRPRLATAYRELCECLATGRMFRSGGVGR